MSKKIYRGNARVTRIDSDKSTTAPITISVNDDGTTDVQVGGLGEGHIESISGGDFNNAPFAGRRRLHRLRGYVERHAKGNGISGGFTVSHHGRDMAKGEFSAE